MSQYVDHHPLTGMCIAILLTDGFEQVEMTAPRQALEAAGASIRLVSAKSGKVKGFNHDTAADEFAVDLTFEEAYAQDFDALLLPGGALNSDQIRIMPGAQRLVQEADEEGKPIAVICHGSWLLVSAKLVEGRTLTSWPTLQDDIRNAGGTWVDQEVVSDGNWISSRKPDDIPAFSEAFIRLMQERKTQSMHLRQGEPPHVGPSG